MYQNNVILSRSVAEAKNLVVALLLRMAGYQISVAED